MGRLGGVLALALSALEAFARNDHCFLDKVNATAALFLSSLLCASVLLPLAVPRGAMEQFPRGVISSIEQPLVGYTTRTSTRRYTPSPRELEREAQRI